MSAPDVDLPDLSIRTVNNRDDWDRFVTSREQQVRMAVGSEAELAAMSRTELNVYNFRRKHAHANLPIHLTGPFGEAEKDMLDRLTFNTLKTTGIVRTGIVLDGPKGGMGKTTLVQGMAADFHTTLRDMHAAMNIVPLNRDAWVPVVYVCCPPKATVNKFAHRILDFYGQPYRKRDNAGDLLDLAHTCIKRCQTRVIIVDEVTRLSLKRQDDVSVYDSLRDLQNTGATLILVGVNVEDSNLVPDEMSVARDELGRTQTTRRFVKHRIEPFDLTTDANAGNWLTHLDCIEKDLVLHEDATGSLVDEATYLLDRTGGVVGSLADLIGQAANKAIGREERIERKHLDSVLIDAGAESFAASASAATGSARVTTTAQRRAGHNSVFDGNRDR